MSRKDSGTPQRNFPKVPLDSTYKLILNWTRCQFKKNFEKLINCYNSHKLNLCGAKSPLEEQLVSVQVPWLSKVAASSIFKNRSWNFRVFVLTKINSRKKKLSAETEKLSRRFRWKRTKKKAKKIRDRFTGRKDFVWI